MDYENVKLAAVSAVIEHFGLSKEAATPFEELVGARTPLRRALAGFASGALPGAAVGGLTGALTAGPDDSRLKRGLGGAAIGGLTVGGANALLHGLGQKELVDAAREQYGSLLSHEAAPPVPHHIIEKYRKLEGDSAAEKLIAELKQRHLEDMKRMEGHFSNMLAPDQTYLERLTAK